MKKILILSFVFTIVFYSNTLAQDNFWSRVNLGILGGPLFPAGDEVDAANLSTGYYIGLDARYQLFRFMAIGISAGLNSWNGEVSYGLYEPGYYSPDNQEISSKKTNVCLSMHFGPSAPTWTSITSYETDITDVKPYTPGMIVPFFVVEIGPYFWNWTQENQFESYEESGSDIMLRGTLAGFYQMTKLVSFTLGFSYTLYDFSTDFTAAGIFGGIRFNMGEVIKSE